MQLSNQKRRRWRSRTRQPKPAEVVERRFVILKALVVMLFGVLVLQLARMQLVDHEEYDARAESNRLREIPELPARGLIYDRNGEQLVHNEPIFSAAIVPADVPEDEFLITVAGVSEITGEAPDAIARAIAEASDSKDPYTPVIVKEGLDEQTAFRLRERQSDLPGARVVVESVRRYSFDDLVSHYLGYVGRIDAEEYELLKDEGYHLNDKLGKSGVELTYEGVLRGLPGYRQVEIDAAGREIREIYAQDPRPAGSLVLSLDLDLQRKVRDVLQGNLGDSLNAVAVVMDVDTGGVLSMVSLPSYDNNVLTGPIEQDELDRLLNDPAKPLVNHAIAEVHPPGSTFKQVTGTAALQEGVANSGTTITSYGSITIEDQYNPDRIWVMKDWAALGTMDFYRGLAMSSDVYFYYLSGGYFEGGRTVFAGLGAERLARYARAYGFGTATGIDLPGEAAGNVPDPEWKEETFGEEGGIWTLGDTYNFGIGQGFLTVTPLQLVRMIAAIANGGDVMVPRVVSEIVDQDGNVLQAVEPEVQHELPISEQNLSIMREALRQAAVYGPARTGASSVVTVAAKTGTAEFGQPLPDGTYPLSHAWFTAYAPYEDPEIAVAVFLEKGVGATNAGPVAKQIIDYYFGRRFAVEGEDGT